MFGSFPPDIRLGHARDHLVGGAPFTERRGLLSDAMLPTNSNAEKFRSSKAAQEDLARRQDS